MAWYQFRPYVSAAEKKRQAAKAMAKRAKKGLPVEAVAIEGRAIARTFWGKAWCDHLERYCDFENRLPRGRTYVRNGSVVHLGIAPRRIEAFVQGSELYEVEVSIAGLARPRWKKIVGACAGQIDSLVELLQGKVSSGVMKIVTDPREGLFPATAQIEMKCSCPDWATMCKHVAAVLYGIGARLDTKPELLFVLRGVDHLELLDAKAAARATKDESVARNRIADDQLASVFGIEIDAGVTSRGRTETRDARRARRSASEIAETVDEIVALLKRHPNGLRAEQIRDALGLPSAALPRPIAEGLSRKRLLKKGQKRATTYFAGR
jgi:uncharacterized Zn finger protein